MYLFKVWRIELARGICLSSSCSQEQLGHFWKLTIAIDWREWSTTCLEIKPLCGLWESKQTCHRCVNLTLHCSFEQIALARSDPGPALQCAMPALHLLGSEPEFIVYMLRRQDILYPSVSPAKPNPINTLWVADTLAEAQHFRMLNNGNISHHINYWRHFMNRMLFTIFLQTECCHRNITTPPRLPFFSFKWSYCM